MSLDKCKALREEAINSFTQENFDEALPKFEAAKEEAVKAGGGEESSKLILSCALNIASCCIKVGKFEQAAEAATEALSIDKKSHKALFRRGQARRQLKQYSKARIDLVMAMELTEDPGIKKELDALRKEQAEAGGGSAAPSSYSSTSAGFGAPAPSRGKQTSAEADMLRAMLANAGAAPAATNPLKAKAFVPTPAQHALVDAATAGDKDKQFELGENFDDGKNGYVRCPVRSYEWYAKAAEQGHPTATRFTAWALKTGTGVEEDVSKAFALYTKAADEYKDVKAMACLGYCYDKGDGVSENLEKAFQWYGKAAEAGDNVAQVNLALCYEKGRGTDKDGASAFKWFNTAAESGNLNAYINVGLYSEKGDGGQPKDMPKAFSWYLKAAKAGDPTGMAVTGWCYERGEGVSVDKEEALNWYTMGAQKKNTHAQQGLQRLMKEKGY